MKIRTVEVYVVEAARYPYSSDLVLLLKGSTGAPGGIDLVEIRMGLSIEAQHQIYEILRSGS